MLDYLGGDVFAFRSLHQIDGVQWDALAFGEADGGAGGGARGVVSDRLGSAGDFVFDVCLFGDEAANPGGEATRSAEGFDGDALLVIFGGEVAFENGLQFGDRAGEHAGGNFFGADFEEEFDAVVGFDGGLGHGRSALCSLLSGGHWGTAGSIECEEGGLKPPLHENVGENVGAPTFKVLLEGFTK